ncbi:MAG: DUF177 domain-containing protein [Bacteroidales bacterium]|nr:DUF177 domain-containing protein [Candidatus Cacconaster merdequi]
MDEMNNIVIPIKGLPAGEHTFTFAIDGKFFQEFDNSQIKEADCTVRVSVIRRQTLLSVECLVGGFVITECDRCLEDLTLKVDVQRSLTVGFGSVDVDEDENGSEDEDVIVVDSSETQLSLDQFVYDYVCLSLPIVKVHPEGKCNPEMLKYLSGNRIEVEDTVSPFKGLKDMLAGK